MDNLAIVLSVFCIILGIVCLIGGTSELSKPIGCISIFSGVCGLLRF